MNDVETNFKYIDLTFWNKQNISNRDKKNKTCMLKENSEHL